MQRTGRCVTQLFNSMNVFFETHCMLNYSSLTNTLVRFVNWVTSSLSSELSAEVTQFANLREILQHNYVNIDVQVTAFSLNYILCLLKILLYDVAFTSVFFPLHNFATWTSLWILRSEYTFLLLLRHYTNAGIYLWIDGTKNSTISNNFSTIILSLAGRPFSQALYLTRISICWRRRRQLVVLRTRVTGYESGVIVRNKLASTRNVFWALWQVVGYRLSVICLKFKNSVRVT